LIAKVSPVPLIDDVNPDEAVAIGAAVQAILVMLQEEKESGQAVLSEDTRQQFSSREGGLMQVTDITSHTLGVVLWDDGQHNEYVYPMINKMSPIPASAKNFFGTANANMPRAVVRIVEGESTMPGECTSLGTCDVELPPFLPKGSPVELCYEYNLNQVLEVSVHAAGNEKKVLIARNTGLAPDEIEKAKASLATLNVT
jgi:molecular chaperone DnaK (HSP70)